MSLINQINVFSNFLYDFMIVILTWRWLAFSIFLECKFGEWNNWSGCSRTCGGGTRTRACKEEIPNEIFDLVHISNSRVISEKVQSEASTIAETQTETCNIQVCKNNVSVENPSCPQCPTQCSTWPNCPGANKGTIDSCNFHFN